jgi:hypothetical protein
MSHSSELLRATEAVTNWRALAATAIAALAFVIMLSITAAMFRTSAFMGLVASVLTFIIGLIGYSSIGITLMRQAQGIAIGLGEAIIQAALTVHRLLGFAVMLFLIYFAIALAALLILAVCKIPGIGPFLYAIVFPALTAVLGVVIAGMLYVIFPLAAPAIWEGNTVLQTVARMSVIIRKQLVAVIIKLIVLAILVFLVSSVVWLILMAGYMSTTGLSAAVGIDAFGGLFSGMRGMFMDQMNQGGYNPYGNPFGESMGNADAFATASHYAEAFGFGTGLLFAIGMIIPLLTYINGSCLIYLQTAAGLHFDEEEQRLRDRVDEAKQRAQEAKERAAAKLQESRQESANQAGRGPTQRQCVSCHAAIAADDVFCGECGTRN